MKRLMIVLIMVQCALAVAVENPYFPMIENSTYTYDSVFKEKKFSDTVVVKAEKRQEVEFFYFLKDKDERNPAAFIGTNNFGRGLYFNIDGNIAVRDCLIRSAMNTAELKDPPVVLKKEPAAGQTVETKAHKGAMVHTWTVLGFEDVTVPAGTFKECVKIKLEEVWPEHKLPEQRLPSGEMKPGEVKPEQKYTGTAWLAKGVGLVKWQRGTGRVDELTAFKIAEPKKVEAK